MCNEQAFCRISLVDATLHFSRYSRENPHRRNNIARASVFTTVLLQISPVITGTQLFLSAILAVATAVLAWVTWQYANEAEAQTSEMEKTRKANIRPVLQPTIEMWTNLHYRFTFRNTGSGAAHNVTARWGFSHMEYEEEWHTPLISPEDEHNFMFPFSDDPPSFTTTSELEDELDDDSMLYFQAKYSDPFGNEYSTSEELPVLKIAKSGAHVEQFQEDELKRIRKKLEDIEDALSS